MATEAPVVHERATDARRKLLLDALLLGACFALLAAVAWRKTPDVLIDFGMQLYLPWQISEGKNLYVDLAWKHGPLSQYLNGFLFRLFGPSLTTLMVFNLGLTASLTALCYRFFRLAADRGAAIAAGLIFLCLFAFSQYIRMGNWNYLTPYTHEATHGTWLAIATILCLMECHRTEKRGWMLAAGGAFGAVCLTKLEFIIPTGAAAATWFAIQGGFRFRGLRRLGDNAGTFLLAAAVPILAALAVLGWRTSFPVAIANLWTSWTLALRSNAAQTALYRSFMGTDHLTGNLWQGAQVLAGWLGVIGLAFAGEILARRHAGNRWILIAGAAGLTGTALSFVTSIWDVIARPFPVFCGLAMVLGFRELRRAGDDESARRRGLGMMLWGILALLFQLKIFFRVEIPVYGFIHAMPAGLLVVALLTSWIPNEITRFEWRGDMFRGVVLGLLAITVLKYQTTSTAILGFKNFVAGTGGDRILTFPPEIDDRGLALETARQDLAVRMKPGDTLTPLPEGILLNYWLRKPTPVPYLAYNPFDITTYGGEAVTLDNLRRHPSTFVVVIHRPTPEWKTPFFGTSPLYGQSIMEWVRANYHQVRQIGAQPFTSENFGIAIYEKNSVPNP